MLILNFSYALAIDTPVDPAQPYNPPSDNLNPFQSNGFINIYSSAFYDAPTVIPVFLKIAHSLETQTMQAALRTDQLVSGNLYSIWWLAIRQPQFCQTPWECNVSDLIGNGGDPRAGAVAIWADDFIADNGGVDKISVLLSPNSALKSAPPMPGFDIGPRALYKIFLRAH